ncbi:MAG: MFS transporter [Solibacillus sp.]
MVDQNAIQNEKWKRDITLFLSSQTISLFGSSLVQYAMMWYITLSTQSGMMMTLYIICGFIPTFLLSPVAGVWADRFNRKKLIIIADGMIAFATLILAIVFMLGYDSIWLLFVMAAIRAVGAGIQTPAVGAILPQIVPEQHLMRVNGINGTIQAVVMFVSPMVSAALLSLTSMNIIFFIDVITAIIAITVLVTLLKIPLHAKAAQQQDVSYLADFKLGIQYIKQHDFLKSFFVFFAVLFVLMAPVAFLTPLQVTRSFGDEYWRLTAIEITFSIGMMIGGIVIASWGGFRNRVYTMMFAGVVMAICTILLGILPVFSLYLVAMALFGLAMPMFNTPTMTIIQEKVETDYLGRIYGVFGMISTSMMPLGMLIFGPLADIISVEKLLLGTGIFMLIVTLLINMSKSLVSAGEPLPKKIE